MSKIIATWASLAVVSLAACGGDDSADHAEADASTSQVTTGPDGGEDGADEEGEEAGDEVPDPGSYPNEPQFSDHLSTCPEWAPAATCREGTFTLGGEADTTLVPVPMDVEPGNRGTLMELVITSMEGEGEVGLACRSSFVTPFTGYALTGNHEEGWTLWGFEDGTRQEIDNPLGSIHQNVAAGSRGPVVLRLGCGWGTGPGEPVGLLFSVNDQPMEPVAPMADETGLDVDEARSRVGIVALSENGEELDVGLEEFTLRLAE